MASSLFIQLFFASRCALVCLLTLQLALPAETLAQMSDQRSNGSPIARTKMKSQSNRPLTSDEKILQALDRLTYGPRPGDLERVRALGLNAWFNQQMNPMRIDDSALESRLADYPAMQLPFQRLMDLYPTKGMIRATMNGRGDIPSDEAERAIYSNQTARQENKKEGKQQQDASDNDMAPLSLEEVDGILALSPDDRFSALCRMKLSQLHQFRWSLTPKQRAHLTEGFTPRQLEAIAAFNSPQGVVAAEDVQTKLLRDIYTERQVNEVMVDFWLNHFNVYMGKSQQAPYYIASYERDVIRPHALGRFEDLLVATAGSPAMLNYLEASALCLSLPLARYVGSIRRSVLMD